jgi:hypothetical protein
LAIPLELTIELIPVVRVVIIRVDVFDCVETVLWVANVVVVVTVPGELVDWVVAIDTEVLEVEADGERRVVTPAPAVSNWTLE